MSTFGVDLGPDSDVQQPLEYMTDAERLAMIQANIALERIRVITERNDLKTSLLKWRCDKQQAIVLCVIDTGSARTVQKMFIKSLRSALPVEVFPRVVVLAGPSLTGCSVAEQDLNNEFPSLGVFLTKLTSENSTTEPMSGAKQLKRQTYGVNEWAVVAKSQSEVTEQFGVPHVLDKFPNKLRKLDKATHVCIGQECGFFKGKSGEMADAKAKVHSPSPADTEDNVFADMMSRLLDDAGADLFEAQPSSGGKQRPIWTFMRSQQFYSKLFKDLMQLTTAGAVVIISSTGCPHAPLAALEGGAPEVFFVVDRLPAHQIYHTKVALQSLLVRTEQEKLNVKKGPTFGQKRTLFSDLQFIQIAESVNCLMEFEDVSTDSGNSLNCLDACMRPLSAESVLLQKAELESQDFVLSTSKVKEGMQGVFTTKSIPHGTVICEVSVVWFSSERFVSSFLRLGGNGKYADRLVVANGKARNFSNRKVYAIFVGLAGEINYATQGRSRNVLLRLNPATGPNHGSLELVAATNNTLPIGPKSELLFDYGTNDLELALYSEQPQKKRVIDYFNQPKDDATKEEPLPANPIVLDEDPTLAAGNIVDPPSERPEGFEHWQLLSAFESFKLWQGTCVKDGKVQFFLASDGDSNISTGTLVHKWPGGTLRKKDVLEKDYPAEVKSFVSVKVQSNSHIVVGAKVAGFEECFKECLKETEGLSVFAYWKAIAV